MGILNNIWMAISTPNESLLSILLIPFSFIEGYLILYMSMLFLHASSTFNKKIKYLFFMCILGLLNMFLLPAPFYILINFFIMIILGCCIFKVPFLKCSFAIIASAMIFGILNFLLLNPFLYIFNINAFELTNIPLFRILYLFIVYLFIYLFIFGYKHINFKFTFLDNMNKNTKFIVFLNLILAIFTLIVQSIILFYYLDYLPLWITFFSALALIVYFTISLYSLTKISKLAATRKELEITKDYNNTLRILHDNIRSFKHDFDNIVTTIGGYVKTNDMEGLNKYYSQLQDDCQKVNNLSVLNPDIINNNGIYNLLTTKYNAADSKNIKVNISFLLDLNNLKMKIYEFSRILGILLDNAIEASSESKEKIINLTFRNDPKNSRQLIIVENSYGNKAVNTEKIFEKGISGKENHSGLGLWEVRKILSKTTNANLFTTKNKDYFIQQIELYY